LPKSMEQIKDHYMREKGGDREFVDLLLLLGGVINRAI